MESKGRDLVRLREVLEEMKGIKGLKEEIRKIGEELRKQSGNFSKKMEELGRKVRGMRSGKKIKGRWKIWRGGCVCGK